MTLFFWSAIETSKTLIPSVNDAIDDCSKEDFIVPKLTSLCMSVVHGSEKTHTQPELRILFKKDMLPSR